MKNTQVIVSGSSNALLAQNISKLSSIKLDQTYRSKFPNQELRIRILSEAQEYYLVQSFSHPVNSHIIEFLLLADAAHRSGSKNTVGIVPWFGYSKQDKVFRPGEPLSVKVIAKIIQSSQIHKLITIDLHNPSIAGYFDIPVVNIDTRPLFASYLKSRSLNNYIVISPDAGSVKSATTFSRELNLPIAYINKHRNLNTGEVNIVDINRDIKNLHTIIVDDMIATGSTLIKTSKFLKNQGARSITVFATHHLFIPGVQEKLDDSPIDQLIITDSITAPQKLKPNNRILSVAPLVKTYL